MSQQAPPEVLGDRYGAPTGARRRLPVILVALLGAVGLGVAVWIGLGVARDPVQWQNVGYRVLGSDQVEVTFDVFMQPGTRAECTLKALDSRFAEVGVRTVPVAAARTNGQRVTGLVATAEGAVTGVVDACRELKATAR